MIRRDLSYFGGKFFNSGSLALSNRCWLSLGLLEMPPLAVPRQTGIIAGAVFMMLEMLLVALVKGGSPWGPPRLIAAILLGKEVLPPPATFALGMFLAALVVHFALSIVFGIALAFVVNGLDMGIAIAIGFAFGLIFYFVNFYGFTAVFPWFATARNPVTIFTHLVFGAVVALVYKRMQTPAIVPA